MSPAPRVLILGAGGMLGGYLVPVCFWRGFTVEALPRTAFDVCRDPWDRVPWEKYDAVINALGAIPQKVSDPKTLARINAEFPRTVAPLCRRWIQVSTDCVFSGKRGQYTVEDVPDPVDAYGQSKVCGEVGVVVRGSFVGEGGPAGLLEVVRRTRSMVGYTDHWWNGVSCLEMSRMLADLVLTEDMGVIHVAGPDRLSKSDLCGLIATVYHHPLILTPKDVGFVDRTLVPTRAVTIPLAEQLAEQRTFTRWTS